MTGKYDFCSDAYLDVAREFLARLVETHGPALGVETFSSCVVCFDAPAQLGPAPDGTVAWTMSVAADRSSVSRGRNDDVDSMVLADYTGSLPRARRILSDDADETSQEDASVRRTGDLSKLSPAMRALLRAFHNQMAAVTA